MSEQEDWIAGQARNDKTEANDKPPVSPDSGVVIPDLIRDPAPRRRCLRGAGSVVKRLGRNIDIARPNDRPVIDKGHFKQRRTLQLHKRLLVHVRRHVEDALLAILELKMQQVACFDFDCHDIQQGLHCCPPLLQWRDTEGLFACKRKFPVGEQLVLVDFNPCLHHFQLFWRESSSQDTAVFNRNGRIAARVPDMNMRQIMALVVLEQDGYQDSIKHADRWHLSLVSSTKFVATCYSKSRAAGSTGNDKTNVIPDLEFVIPDLRSLPRTPIRGDPVARGHWIAGQARNDKPDARNDSRLSRCVRETDTVARVGGDEFVVLLGELDTDRTGVYISRDGEFEYANPRLEQMLGYGPGELVGLRIEDLVIAQDLPLLQAQRAKLRAGEISIAYEARARCKDGSIIELGVQGHLLQTGEATSTIGMAQDITEKKRAEKDIQRYLTQLQSAFMSTVEVATTLSEMRDPYTAGHERRVGKLAAAIGAVLGFDAQAQEGLRVAGYLHDIGKITIPAEILSKPGKLSAVEFALIQGHPQASYDVLKDVQFPWPVAQVALQHHERMDGSGYPQGLKGEAILLETRIMAVADVVEAMFSHRPYRPGLGIDKALAEIERGRGSSYDPAVADACLKLFRELDYVIAA